MIIAPGGQVGKCGTDLGGCANLRFAEDLKGLTMGNHASRVTGVVAQLRVMTAYS